MKKSPLLQLLIQIQKAKRRNEGETWTQPSGRRVTKKNGKIVPVVGGKGKKKEEPKKEEKKKQPELTERQKDKEEKKQSILALTGEKYYTFFKKFLDVIKKRTGIGRSEVIRQKIKKEHEDYLDTGAKASFEVFHASYLEYYKNKEKWDKYFQKRENKPKLNIPKPSGEKKPKEKGDKKPKKKKPYDKKILRYLYELNKPKDIPLKQGEKITLDPKTRFNEYVAYGGKKLLTGRENLTQLPDKNFISEDIQKHLAPHQMDSVNLALGKYEQGEKGFLLADGTGAGKTRQALALAASYLQTVDPNKPVIIVTESDNIINTAWMGAGGDAEQMGIKINNAKINGFIPGMINITTYSQAEKVKDFPDKGLIIMDEAHNIKNQDSDAYKMMSEATKAADHVFLASATPIDKVEHIQYICDSLEMDFDKTLKAVRNKDPYQEAMNLDSLFEDITRQGLMVKREVPFSNLKVSLNKTKISAKNQMKLQKAMEAIAESGNRSRFMEVRRLAEEFKAEAAIDDIVNDIAQGKQVVFFADRVSDSKIMGFDSSGTLPLMEKKLKERGIDFVSVYGGNQSKADRDKVKEDVAKFQNGEVKVIIGNPESMGTGISLDDSKGIAPRTMRIMSTPYSAMDAIQMLGRVNRLMTRTEAEAIFYNIDDNPVDEWNLGILKDKFLALGATVGGDYAGIDLEGKGLMFKPGTKEPPPLKVADFKKEKNKDGINTDGIKKSGLWSLFEFFKILKARSVKYYRRTGVPGDYTYYYTKEQWDKAHKKQKKTHKINKEHPDVKKPENPVEMVEKERDAVFNALRKAPKGEAGKLREKLIELNKRINDLKNSVTTPSPNNNGVKEDKPVAKERPEISTPAPSKPTQPVTRGVEVEAPKETVQTVTPEAKKPTENPQPIEVKPPEVSVNKVDQPKPAPTKTVNPKYQASENQFARIQSGDSDALIRFAQKLWMEGGSASGLANAINKGRLNQDDLQDAIQKAYLFAWKKHTSGEFKDATPATLTSYLNRALHYKINEEAKLANKHVYDTDMLQKVEIEYGITPEDQFIEKEDLAQKVEEVKVQLEKVKEAVTQNVQRVRQTTSRNEQVWAKYLDNYSKGKPDYRGIAAEFGLGENQVKQIIKNTKNKLKASEAKGGTEPKESKPKAAAKKKPAAKKKAKKKTSKKLKSIWATWLNGGI